MNQPLNDDPNIQILTLIAEALGDLCDSLVFVGGCATGLLVTSVRTQTIRVTDDVDVVAQVMSAREYHELEKKVAERGFAHDMSPGAPICRWVHQGIKLDLMPSEEKVLGFNNHWYPIVLRTATAATLPSGRTIRLISGPAFIASKLEAFKDRGNGDFLSSHDMEDIVTIIDGREQLLEELQASDPEMLSYVVTEFSALLEKADFLQALSGHLPGDAASQSRLSELIKRFKEIAVLRRR
jgi:predicted nucleotidyltransferase